MAYREDLTWAEVIQKMIAPARTLIREMAAAKEVSDYLADAQDVLTDLAWGRILFETGDTKNVTLIIDATAKTISCRTGANLFANHRVGRNVQITGFTVNPTNNDTVEITSKISNDSIGISGHTGLVDETDTSARAQENPEQFELDKITALKAALVGIDDMDLAFNGTAVSSVKDVAALLRDFA